MQTTKLTKLDTEILFFDGQPVKVSKESNDALTIGRAIARILSLNKSEDPHRAYVLAKMFYGESEVSLNANDLSFIRNAIKADNNFAPIVLGQILEQLEE